MLGGCDVEMRGPNRYGRKDRATQGPSGLVSRLRGLGAGCPHPFGLSERSANVNALGKTGEAIVRVANRAPADLKIQKRFVEIELRFHNSSVAGRTACPDRQSDLNRRTRTSDLLLATPNA